MSLVSNELDLYWKNLASAVLNPDSVLEHDCINGVRISDKTEAEESPAYNLEAWLSTNDEALRSRLQKQIKHVITGEKDYEIALDWRWSDASNTADLDEWFVINSL
jgi:hypothetical protein